MIYGRKQINIETHAVLFFCVCQQQFPNQNAGLFVVRRYKSVNNYLHTYLETVYLFGQTNALIIYLMICVYDLMSQPEKQKINNMLNI